MKIKRVYEFLENEFNFLTENDLENLISINGDLVGLDRDIFIWLGPNNNSYNRIKISPNKKNRLKTFTIDIDNMVLLGDYDSNQITKNDINNIFRWIRLNREIIEIISSGEKYNISILNDLVSI